MEAQSICLLFLPPKAFSIMLSLPFHNIAPDTMRDALIDLVRRGLIGVTDSDDIITDPNDAADAVISCAGMPSGKGSQLMYQLTSVGAYTWEAFVNPSWQLFVKESYVTVIGPLHGKIARINGTSRARLVGHCLKLRAAELLVPASYGIISRVDSWRPTYWKELSAGFQIDMVGTLPVGSEPGHYFEIGVPVIDEVDRLNAARSWLTDWVRVSVSTW
jgi:hypothetical protein